MFNKLSLVVLSVLLLSASVFAAPWDIFREPVQVVGNADTIISWVLLIVAFALVCIASLALRKKPSSRLKWVTVAFGVFFIKALLIVIDVYFSPGYFMNFAVQGLFDVVILGILFVGLFRK